MSQNANLSLSSGFANVEPGNPIVINAIIHNFNPTPEDFLLSVRSVDPAWVTFQPPAFTVGAGQQAIISVVVRPPAGITDGNYLPIVQLISRQQNIPIAEASFTLQVGMPNASTTAPIRTLKVKQMASSGTNWLLYGLIGAGVLAVALVGALLYFLFFNNPGNTTKTASVGKSCAPQPTKLVSLFSDNKTTAIRLSNADLSEMRILRTEPADVLPGLYDSLLALSSTNTRVGYVTAKNMQMDDAVIYYIDVTNPLKREELARISSGFWNVKPVWSPDNNRLVFIKLNDAKASAGETQLELWVAEIGSQPRKINAPLELKPDIFFGSPTLPLCWAEDNKTVIFDNATPTGGGRGQQTEVNTETGESVTSPRPTQPVTVAQDDKNPPQSASLAANTPCGVPIFSQNDPAWRKKLMQSGGDLIGDYGCALTSVTMLFNYYGAPITPNQLNDCLGPAADPIYWAQAAGCTNGAVSYTSFTDFSWQRIDQVLAGGSPVIVGLIRGQTGMHFVVVTSGGGGNAANYAVTDPWDASTNKSLQYFFNSGYNPFKLITYSGPGKNCTRIVPSDGVTGIDGVTDGGVYNNPVIIGDLTGNPSSLISATIINLSPEITSTVDDGTPITTTTAGVTTTPATTTTAAPTTGGGGGIYTLPPWFKLNDYLIPYYKYKKNLVVKNEGIYQALLYYKPTSVLGGVKLTRVKFTIDKTPPLLDVSLINAVSSGGSSSPVTPLATTAAGLRTNLNIAAQPAKPQSKGPAKLQVVTQDILSGVATIETQLDNGGWELYSNEVNYKKTLLVTVPGNHTIAFRATDLAGNVSTVRTFDFEVLPENGATPTPTTTAAPTTTTVATTTTPTTEATTTQATTVVTPRPTTTTARPTTTAATTTVVTPSPTLTPPPALLKVSSTTLTFTPTQARQLITLTNAGGVPLNWQTKATSNANLFNLTAEKGTIEPGKSVEIGVSVNRQTVAVETTASFSISSNGGNNDIKLIIQPIPISADFSNYNKNTYQLGGRLQVSFVVTGPVDHINLSYSYPGNAASTPKVLPSSKAIGKTTLANQWTILWDTSQIPPANGIVLNAVACRTGDDSLCTYTIPALNKLFVVQPAASFTKPLPGSFSYNYIPVVAATITAGNNANHISFYRTPLNGTSSKLGQLTAASNWSASNVGAAQGNFNLTGVVCWSVDDSICFPMAPVNDISVAYLGQVGEPSSTTSSGAMALRREDL